jgi:hypothetical protein
MRFSFPVILTALVACVGCSKQIIVSDGTGKPVAGALVKTATASTGPGYSGRRTDTDGKAIVETSNIPLQPTLWVFVDKDGFDRVCVDIPSTWPLRITLAPKGTSKGGIQMTTQPTGE